MNTRDREYIVTFGQAHVHPITQERLENRFIRVHAPSELEARVKVVKRFGNRWAFIYTSEEAAGVEQYGLQEIDASLPV